MGMFSGNVCLLGSTKTVEGTLTGFTGQMVLIEVLVFAGMYRSVKTLLPLIWSISRPSSLFVERILLNGLKNSNREQTVPNY